MQAIKAIDYYLLPLYIALASIILIVFRKKFNPDKNTYKIYYTAFFVKLAGALLFAFIAQYYYGYGDSLIYFDEARIFHNHIVENVSNVKYFFSSVEDYKNLYNPQINFATANLYNDSNLLIIRITTLFTFLSFNTYLTTTVLLVMFSFSGMWAIYLTFISIIPKLKRQFAWGILYLPSVIFWSSGIMKDSVSIACLGWIFYFFYKYFIFKEGKKNIYLLAIFLCIYLTWVLKFYIIVVFTISFLLIGIIYIFFKIRPIYKRIIFSLIFIAAFCLLLFTDNAVSGFLSKFSSTMIADNIEKMQKLYLGNKLAGEGNFSIGDIDQSFSGILSKVPAAIATVLYRPFIWESKTLIMFFSGLENLILLVLSIYVFIRCGLINFFKIIGENSLVQFCLLFTIIFATVVGLTTFNFGTLLRYKVPCMPFYTCFLIIVNYKAGLLKKKKIHLALLI